MDILKSSRNKTKSINLKIGITITIIFSLLLLNLIFNFFKIFNSILLGVFGLLTYVIFIAVIIIGILLILNKHFEVKLKAVLLTVLWLVIFICLMQVLSSYKLGTNYGEYLINCYNYKITAGGVFFGLFCFPLLFLFQLIGSIIFLICQLLINSAIIVDLFFLKKNVGIENCEKTREVNKEQEKYNLDKEETNEIDDLEDDENLIKSRQEESGNFTDDDFIIKEYEDEKEKSSAIKILGLKKDDNIGDVDIISNNKTPNSDKKPPLIIHAKEEEKEKIIINDFEKKPAKNVELDERAIRNKEYLKTISGDFAVTNKKKGIDNISINNTSNNYDINNKNDNAKKMLFENNNIYDSSLTKKKYYDKKDDIANNIANIDEATYELNNNNTQALQNNNSLENDDDYSTVDNYIENKKLYNNDNNKNDSLNNNYNRNNVSNNDKQKLYSDGSLINGNNVQTQKNWVDKNKLFDGSVKENRVDGKTVGEQTKINLNKIALPIDKPKPKHKYNYNRPDLSVLKDYLPPDDNLTNSQIAEKGISLENILESFSIPAKVSSFTIGPTFTRFEMKMPLGIPVRSVEKYEKDIRMILATEGSIRMEIPIPGKNAFGIEIPNSTRTIVGLKDIMQSYTFEKNKSPLTFAIGKDINGDCIVNDVEKTLHMLIAGTSGSGKSICLSSLLVSMMYKSSPDDVRFILIDPKRVEFTLYNNMPHLLIPNVITDTERAIMALHWSCVEMDRRFDRLAQLGVKNIVEYNHTPEVMSGLHDKMQYIVIIIDELNDLMTQKKKEIEEEIRRLTAKSRAAGIYLILCTQRPSVDVITGVIKANLGTRIAFSVMSFRDSQTILDCAGADTLLGKGDMLLMLNGANDLKRIQGSFVSTDEIDAFVKYVKENNENDYDERIEQEMFSKNEDTFEINKNEDEFDPLMKDALRSIIKRGNASASMLQSLFNIGYPKANRIINQMVSAGFVSESDNKNKRSIFITQQEFEEKFGEDL